MPSKLVPLGAFAGARVVNVIGVCLAVALLASNRVLNRPPRRESARP